MGFRLQFGHSVSKKLRNTGLAQALVIPPNIGTPVSFAQLHNLYIPSPVLCEGEKTLQGT